MKTKLTIIAFFLIIGNAHAQDENLKHFEIDVSVNFWTPSSTHMKATNSVTQIHINDNYISNGGISGYGTSIAPKIDMTYYFNNCLGISLGFYPLIMDNKLNIQKTDTSFVNYENEAFIANFTLGFAGKIPTSTIMTLYYGFGFNFVANYDLEKKASKQLDIEANDMTGGLYLKMGIKIKLYKFLSLISGIEYSFIPSKLEYTNSEGVKINEKTDLGGLGLQTGLSFNF
jgi:outer membrane protein W